MLNLEKIGRKISILRKERQMKQAELADALYVTHQAVSKWENGKSIPSIEILYSLTQLFNVSIDYILQDSDIEDDNYQALLKNYPRESIIKKALESKNIDEESEKIFYLLSKEERKTIINRILSGQLQINIECLWHVLSDEEREFILVVILKNKFKYDLNKIYNKLSDQEQNLIKSHINNGTYCFIIPKNKKGVIL